LEQLRKQAKDLLKGHAAGKVEVCGALRRLRRFARASEEEILASSISLSEAQFALAMGYGFKSWPELKRHVEASTGAVTEVEVKQDGRGAWIAGYEEVDWGWSRDTVDNSFMRCLACALNGAGEEVGYEELMGLSGAAFRVQVAQPELCPSAGCAEVGFNCCDPVLEAVGYPMRTIRTQVESGDGGSKDADPETIAQAREAVMESINGGRPAIYATEEHSLLVGYRDSGRIFVIRDYMNMREPGYTEKEALPWAVLVLGKKTVAPDRRDALIGSLKRGLELANTRAFDNYASGFAAYDAWIRAIERGFEHLDGEKAFGWHLGNAHCYWTLCNCREAAGVYLRSIAEELDEEAADHLLNAAELFDRIRTALNAERECAPFPWRITEENPWTEERRARERELLKQALEMDRRAFAEIEQALRVLES
jgi:hypothetical protein